MHLKRAAIPSALVFKLPANLPEACITDCTSKRSNAESTFSMVKAKFRDHVRSKTDVAMKNEVFCKLLCHNICCLIQSQCELGIEARFWPDDTPTDAPVTLPFSRPS